MAQPMTEKQIVKLFRAAREAQGRFQLDLAKLLDMDESQYGRLEGGHRRLKWDEVIYISGLLDIPLSQLTGEQEKAKAA